MLAHAEAERGLGPPSLRGVEPTVRQRDPELAWSAGPAWAPGLHCPPRSKPAFPGPRSPCTQEHCCLRAGGDTRAPAFHRRTLKHRARGFWSKLAAESPARLSPSTLDPLLLLLASCKAGGGDERWDLQRCDLSLQPGGPATQAHSDHLLDSPAHQASTRPQDLSAPTHPQAKMWTVLAGNLSCL